MESLNSHSREFRLSNIVFMGEGEPLMNFKNVMKAVHRIRDDLDIGGRHITISTVGIAPRIVQLADQKDFPQVKLAVSLHSVVNKECASMVHQYFFQ